MKSGLIIGVVPLEGDNLVKFDYLYTSKIWPDRSLRVTFYESGFIIKG
jgi:hypothetical protein